MEEDIYRDSPQPVFPLGESCEYSSPPFPAHGTPAIPMNKLCKSQSHARIFLYFGTVTSASTAHFNHLAGFKEHLDVFSFSQNVLV